MTPKRIAAPAASRMSRSRKEKHKVVPRLQCLAPQIVPTPEPAATPAGTWPPSPPQQCRACGKEGTKQLEQTRPSGVLRIGTELTSDTFRLHAKRTAHATASRWR
jgi:hypothetical protein